MILISRIVLWTFVSFWWFSSRQESGVLQPVILCPQLTSSIPNTRKKAANARLASLVGYFWALKQKSRKRADDAIAQNAVSDSRT